LERLLALTALQAKLTSQSPQRRKEEEPGELFAMSSSLEAKAFLM
jgi:hypothetical protein